MKQHRISALTLFILALVALPAAAAESGEVIFLVGKGTVTEGAVTRSLEKGMKISDSSAITLGKKSFLTIRYKGNDFTISSGKGIRLSSIARAAKPDPAPSPLRKLFERVRSSARTTVLAVRAEKADSGSVVWAEGDNAVPSPADDSAELYARISEMLSSGNYSGAVRFYESNRTRFGSRADDAAYAAALSLFYLCRYDESASVMRPLCDSAADLALRENALFYTAFALHSLSDYAASNAYLERFFRTGERSPSAPYAWYIRGLNHSALGSAAEADRCFRTVTENYPADPIAADAAQLIRK